jgi:hypothetical protein
LAKQQRTATSVAVRRFHSGLLLRQPFAASRLLREAVEKAVATGGDQIGLAAAAGHVSRVPGL